MVFSVENFVSHYQEERPIDWDKQFGQKKPLDVEIGFGLGEFLVRTAMNNPDRNIVGIERDWQRLKKALRRIDIVRRKNHNEQLATNVRILQIDAVVAFERIFRPQTITKICCLFPCPWPKKGHEKYRLFSKKFLQLINSRLIEQGEVQLVTDYEPYFHWVLEQVEGMGFRWEKDIIHPQFDTKFEKKWCAEGQKEFFELRLIKEKHCDIPLTEDEDLRVYFSNDFVPERFQVEKVTGETSIIQKDFLFDANRQKAMVLVVVAEETITQHVWITIIKGPRGWCVAKAAGHSVLPTAGVGKAINQVYQAVCQSIKGVKS